MSYDIAVIDGPAPSTHTQGLEQYIALMDLAETGEAPPPSERLVAFAQQLAERWPGDTDEEFEDSPWASWPLDGDIVGHVLLTAMRFSAADEVVPVIAALAAEHGLVCFDPQSELVLAPTLAAPRKGWRRLLGR